MACQQTQLYSSLSDLKDTVVASKMCFCSSGEFGSVMEGLLTQEESVLKVAVKTMKSE